MPRTTDTAAAPTGRAPRSGRQAGSRAATARKRLWVRPSNLDAPPAPAGFAHRWVSVENRGQANATNASKRFREGFEPVRAEEYPTFAAPTVEDGKFKGVIGVGGLILCRIPQEIVDDRNEQIQGRIEEAAGEIDEQLERDISDPHLPLTREREHVTTVGGQAEFKD
jgi:hypothetical protein